MSSLKYNQKKLLEDVLEMGGGYVFDFTDRTFSEFFRDFEINIYDDKYLSYGRSGSKANRLRAFWEIEPDQLVGCVLFALLELVEAKESSANEKLTRVRQIISALTKKGETQLEPFNSLIFTKILKERTL